MKAIREWTKGQNLSGKYFTAMEDVLRYQRTLVTKFLRAFLEDDEEGGRRVFAELDQVTKDSISDITPGSLRMQHGQSITAAITEQGAIPFHAAHYMGTATKKLQPKEAVPMKRKEGRVRGDDDDGEKAA